MHTKTIFQLYPPNTKVQTDNHTRTNSRWWYDPSIEGHIDLQIRTSGAIYIDNTLGSIGFLANSMDYLRTEHLYDCVDFYNV